MCVCVFGVGCWWVWALGWFTYTHIDIHTTPRICTQAEAKAAQGGDDSDDDGGAAAAAGPKDELADFFSEVRFVCFVGCVLVCGGSFILGGMWGWVELCTHHNVPYKH